MTARWAGGSCSIACATRCIVSCDSSRSSGSVSQRGGGEAQPPGPPVAGALEAIGVDGGLVAGDVRGHEGGERHAARLALPAGLRPVGQDAEQPGLQRRALLEALEPGEDAEPRLLDDLLGRLAVADVQARDPQHRRAVALDERAERELVAAAQAGEQLSVRIG